MIIRKKSFRLVVAGETPARNSGAADFADSFQGAGYTSIAENLAAFSDLGCLPAKLKMSRFADGDGPEQTFSRRQQTFTRLAVLNSTI